MCPGQPLPLDLGSSRSQGSSSKCWQRRPLLPPPSRTASLSAGASLGQVGANTRLAHLEGRAGFHKGHPYIR